MKDADVRTSRTDKNPNRDFVCCPTEEATGTRCTYFRWASADIPRTTCVCGRPLLVLRTKKDATQFVRCYDTQQCGFVHFFGNAAWDESWSASAELKRRGDADAALSAAPAKRQCVQTADIRALMRPVASLVDDMRATELARQPAAAATVDDGGARKTLEVIVLDLVQEVEVLKDTVKRIESTKNLLH